MGFNGVVYSNVDKSGNGSNECVRCAFLNFAFASHNQFWKDGLREMGRTEEIC